MEIDLHRLQVFKHVFARNSVSKAARDLRLSQPAVSQHLKKLEQELRVPLFTRLNKRLVPTPAGQRLYKRMAPLLEDLQKEVQFLNRPAHTPFGLLRIGAAPFFGSMMLPGIINRFRFRFPTVTFQIHQGNESDLLDQLSSGEIDLAIVSQASPGKKPTINPLLYESKILRYEAMTLICSRQYRQRKRLQNYTCDALTDLDYISNGQKDNLLTWWFRHHFSKMPDNLNHVLTSPDSTLQLSGIRSGMGAGIVPDYLLLEEINAGTLTPIATGKQPLVAGLSLVHLKNRVLSLTEKTFCSAVRKELDRLKRPAVIP